MGNVSKSNNHVSFRNKMMGPTCSFPKERADLVRSCPEMRAS